MDSGGSGVGEMSQNEFGIWVFGGFLGFVCVGVVW